MLVKGRRLEGGMSMRRGLEGGIATCVGSRMDVRA